MDHESAPADLSDRVFPMGEPRDGHILLLDHVQTWESQFLGIGRTVQALTDNVLHRDHAADDLGLNLVFLQRHRVEVGLKLILERASEIFHKGHRIPPLLLAVEKACAQHALLPACETFVARQSDFMSLMDEVDEQAATFRYPVDNTNNAWSRRPYVDVAALGEAGEAFEKDLLQLLHQSEDLEELPSIPDGDVVAAVETLAELADRGRGAAGLHQELLTAIRRDGERLGMRRRPERDEADVFSAARAAEGATLTLVARVERMLRRLCDAHSLVPKRNPPDPLPPFPAFDLSPRGFAALGSQQEAQMRWAGEAFAIRGRPLLLAVRRVEDLSRGWSTPAARQLSVEVARFRSRLGAK